MRCLASSIFQVSPESYNARRHLKKGALPLEPRHVILLTGPAGAGKTATASAWAKSHRHPTVHLSIDTIREFVKSRYANPEDGWNGETQRQGDLAQTACSMVAREYVESGYCCAIDDAVFPNWPEVGYGRWQAVLGPIQHRLIVLLPSFDKVLERNRARSGNSHLKEPTLRIIYDRMIEWRDHSDTVVIDNSDLTIDETVEALDRCLESDIPPRACEVAQIPRPSQARACCT